MINNKDFKYIIKRVLIGLTIAFILFNINKCNAYAYVFKNSGYTTFSQGETSTGSLTADNSLLTINTTFTNPIDISNFDLVAFTYNRFNFTDDFDFQLDNPYLASDFGTHYLECIHYDNVNVCDKWKYYNNNNSFPNSLYGSYETGSITIQAQLQSSNGANLCFFDDSYQNTVLCPTVGLGGTATNLQLRIYKYGSNTTYYNIDYYRLYSGFNYDSTEIVNGLGGVQQQQQQTNDTLTDSNITGANTDTNNALGNIENSVGSTLNSSIDANSLNTLLTGFVNQLSNTTCTPITLPIPFTNENLVLPCLGTEFSQRIPVLWSLYELIITGVLVLRFWQHAMEFILNILDPYHIGANNIPNGGGK